MPLHEQMDVRVLVDRQPLIEYTDPEAHPDGTVVTRYVEAIAGQRFTVRVKWLQGYKVGNAPYLYAEFAYDEEDATVYQSWDRHSLVITNGILKRRARFEDTFISVKNEVGRWVQCNYSFGPVELTEDSSYAANIMSSQVNNLGTLRVIMYKARRVYIGEPEADAGQIPAFLNEIPQKLVKGQDMKANVKYDITKIRSRPFEVSAYKYVPLKGKFGGVTTFLFKYRSKKTLKNIGCIPRTPSPPPDYKLIAERMESMLRQQESMFREQKLRCDRLERELAEQKEFSRCEGSILTSVGGIDDDDTLVNGMAGLDIEEDGFTILAPRPKKVIPFIDLTEDD